jgi:dihydrofolate reductase
MIAAAGLNNELGKDNQLLWHLPDDFKRFRELTTGHHIIMGRKTFESFPKPLPNRTHVIITRQPDYHAPGCLIAADLATALSLVPKDQDVYVIGGGEIYRQFLPLADRIELTRVQSTFAADTYFPELTDQWQLTQKTEHPADGRHSSAFAFETFDRKR